MKRLRLYECGYGLGYGIIYTYLYLTIYNFYNVYFPM